ncbi:MAG: NAD-dependent epimerase [Bacillota bacterium]
MKDFLVTGTAGFIGFHLAKKLLSLGYRVVGIDNLNDYYDVKLKENRLSQLNDYEKFTFIKVSLEDDSRVKEIFIKNQPRYVVNLAAQAGVRYSLDNPRAYIDANLVGFLNVLEGCRHYNVEHLIYASSSSVYGANKKMPFSVHDNVDHPISLYAATKKANELIAHTYSHLYRIPTTGLRFFTVYGPWGRPDMALHIFTKAILQGEKIQVFNFGKMKRDFTYIDDIIEGIIGVIGRKPEPNPSWSGENPDPGTSNAPFRLYNIGNNNPVELLDFISIIEKELDIVAIKEFLPMQPGDVADTYADIDDLVIDTGYQPKVSIEEGIKRFIHWYKDYYGIR